MPSGPVPLDALPADKGWETVLSWRRALWDPEQELYDAVRSNPGERVLLKAAVGILPYTSSRSILWVTDARLLFLRVRQARRARLLSLPKAAVRSCHFDGAAKLPAIAISYSVDQQECVLRLRVFSWRDALAGAAMAGGAAGAAAGA